MKYAISEVRMSYAIDHDGRHDPEQDDIIKDDIGWIDPERITDFMRARHPKAIYWKVWLFDERPEQQG